MLQLEARELLKGVRLQGIAVLPIAWVVVEGGCVVVLAIALLQSDFVAMVSESAVVTEFAFPSEEEFTTHGFVILQLLRLVASIAVVVE